MKSVLCLTICGHDAKNTRAEIFSPPISLSVLAVLPYVVWLCIQSYRSSLGTGEIVIFIFWQQSVDGVEAQPHGK
jgi:hypothetical protein